MTSIVIGATRNYGGDWFRELTVEGVTFLAPLDEQDKARHVLATLAPEASGADYVAHPLATTPRPTGAARMTPPAALAPSVALERLEQAAANTDLLRTDLRRVMREVAATLRAGLAQQGEAVAWMLPMTIRNGVPSHIPDFATERAYVERHRQREDWIPLFTHPTAMDEAMVERFCTAAELAMGIESGFYEKMPVREGLRAVFAALQPAATSEGENNG